MISINAKALKHDTYECVFTYRTGEYARNCSWCYEYKLFSRFA